MSSRNDTSNAETSSRKNDFRKSKKYNKSNIRNARGKKQESLDYESEFNQLASGDFDKVLKFEDLSNSSKEQNVDKLLKTNKSEKILDNEQLDETQLEYDESEEEFNDAYFEPEILR